MKSRRAITRRAFIKSASAAAIAAPLLLSAQNEKAAVPAGKSRVVLLRDINVLDENGQPRQDVVQEMLDTGLKTLTGKPDPQSAWKTIIKPDDIVGIKNNRWGYLQTTPQVQNALKKRVLEAGVKENNVSIDDLGVLQNPIFLKSTALINARPLRSHHWAGVGSLIKNYIMFIPEPITIHPDSCADLASIWNLPIVKDNLSLVVIGIVIASIMPAVIEYVRHRRAAAAERA